MSQPRAERSVTIIVTVTLVLMATVMLGTLGAINYSSESSAARQQLDTEAGIDAEQLAAGLALPLWNFDRPQIDKVIESAMSEPNVYSIEVRQADVSASGGVSIYRRARAKDWQRSTRTGPINLNDTIVKTRHISIAGTDLGDLKLAVSPYFVNAALQRMLVALVIRIIALDGILVLILWLLLRRLVLHPLQALERYAALVSTGSRDVPNELKDDNAFGEIARLRKSIESMVSLLDGRYSELQASDAMLLGVMNSVPQSIFWKDRKGKYLGCNAVFARESGHANPRDVIGKTDFDMPWPEDDTKRYRRDDQEVMNTRQVKNHFIEILYTATGETRWFEVTKIPLIDDSDEVWGVLGVYENITERKHTEAVLLESEKMRTVAGLAAGMAHEINNPLAGVVQNAQVVLNRLRPELPANKDAAERAGTTVHAVAAYMKERGIPQMLDAIRTSGHRAAEIVANMLSFSRSSETEPRMKDIVELLDDAIELASHDYDVEGIDFRNVQIVREYAADLPSVPCRVTEIEQVILNLLKNAAQAMAPLRVHNSGFQPRITIRAARSNGFVRLELQDNGPGMSETIRQRAFEPFFTTKDPQSGSGLGLFVSYCLIKRNHGGEISVESKEGSGCKFIILLPVERPRERERAIINSHSHS